MAQPTASVLILEDSGTHTDRVLAKLRNEGGLSVEWERVNTLPALREALTRRSDWQLVISDSKVDGAAPFQALAVTHAIAPGVPFVVLSRGRSKESVAQVIQEWVTHRPLKEHDGHGPVDPGGVALPRLSDFARRLLEAQEAERRHIARELHDELGQMLTAVRLNLESAQRHQGAAAVNAVTEAIDLVNRAIHQVRNFSLELWPTVLDDLGLPAALRWLAEHQMKASTFTVDLEAASLPRLPRPIEIACFRLIQEALTNVARHAAAQQVQIKVQLVPDGLGVLVRDDGVGFDVQAVRQRAAYGGPPSFGLFGMQERVLMAGGQFKVQSVLGLGTTVSARFPLNGVETTS